LPDIGDYTEATFYFFLIILKNSVLLLIHHAGILGKIKSILIREVEQKLCLKLQTRICIFKYKIM